MGSQVQRRQSINPPGTEALYEHYHFSQATRLGDMIWVSGQVGIDANMTPGEGTAAQAELAFEGLKRVLEAAGASLADVVELMTFHTDLLGSQADFSPVKDRYFPDRYPSWTAVGVAHLAMPELLLEIRAVAVAGSGAA